MGSVHVCLVLVFFRLPLLPSNCTSASDTMELQPFAIDKFKDQEKEASLSGASITTVLTAFPQGDREQRVNERELRYLELLEQRIKILESNLRSSMEASSIKTNTSFQSKSCRKSRLNRGEKPSRTAKISADPF